VDSVVGVLNSCQLGGRDAAPTEWSGFCLRRAFWCGIGFLNRGDACCETQIVPPTAKGFIRITSIQPAEQAAGSQNSAGTPHFLKFFRVCEDHRGKFVKVIFKTGKSIFIDLFGKINLANLFYWPWPILSHGLRLAVLSCGLLFCPC
jgi:hypothetical protein